MKVNKDIRPKLFDTEEVIAVGKKETEDEFQQQYDKLIAAANDQFSSKNYDKSKELFIRAKNMNPDDAYPKQKIAEIERTLKDIFDNKQSEEKLQSVLDKYNKLVKQGGYILLLGVGYTVNSIIHLAELPDLLQLSVYCNFSAFFSDFLACVSHNVVVEDF